MKDTRKLPPSLKIQDSDIIRGETYNNLIKAYKAHDERRNHYMKNLQERIKTKNKQIKILSSAVNLLANNMGLSPKSPLYGQYQKLIDKFNNIDILKDDDE